MSNRLLCLALTTTLALALVGCSALAPIPEQQPVQPPGDGHAATVVSLASCWPGLPLLRQVVAEAEAQHSDVVYQLIGTHSAQAEVMLRNGEVSLVLIAVPVSDPPKGERIALDLQVPIVPASSLLESIALEDAIALLGGYRLDWSELHAGAGRPEIVVRETGSVGRQVFEATVMANAGITRAARLLPNDGAIIDHVAAHPLAIGIVSRAWLDDRVREVELVPLDGAKPVGQATIAIELLLAPAADAATRDLADSLASRQGRRLIEQRYRLPDAR